MAAAAVAAAAGCMLFLDADASPISIQYHLNCTIALISAPLTATASGRSTLVGIATVSTECGMAFVYDRLAPHLNWIFENSDCEAYQRNEGG